MPCTASARLLRQLCPASIESVVLVLRRVQFQQCLLEGGGVGGNAGMLDAAVSSGQPGIGFLDPLLDGRELAGFEIGELLLASRAGRRLNSGPLQGT